MKRLQICIEPEQDEALAVEAARTGLSKAAMIRDLVSAHAGTNHEADPIDDLVGSFQAPSGDVDDVVYGR